MADQDEIETDNSGAAFVHDLRQFLHDARDQRDALDRAATAISGSAGLMAGHEAGLQKIHRFLQRQIEQGVRVHIDDTLDAHARVVSGSTKRLENLFNDAVAHWQRQKFEAAIFAFISSILGGAAGVMLTIHLLGRL